jgi:sugar (pentulose or hexulose) kinase
MVYDVDGTAPATSRAVSPDEQVTVNVFRDTVWRPEKLWEAICNLIREAVSQLPDRALDALAIVELGLVWG